MNRCRACPAPIMWAHHKVSNRNNPLDPEPDENGNLLFDDQTRLYEVLTGDDLKRAREQGIKLHISHFATCPARKQLARVKRKPMTLPEGLLASVATKPVADDLAAAVGKRFCRPTYVLHKPEYELPFQIMTDEELTASMRVTIKNFFREYASRQEVPI